MEKYKTLVFLLWVAILSSSSSSQEVVPLNPLYPSDTSSPAATLNSLISACNELQELIRTGPITEERADKILPTTERILDCLDLSNLPVELRNTAGINSGLFLKEVLDRTTLPADEDIPQPAPDSPQTKGLPRWRIPETRLVIGRPESGPRQDQYLFTPDTVQKAADFYRLVKSVPYRTEGRSVSPGLYEAYIAATRKVPAQTSDTSSPRGTLMLFLNSCDEFYEEVRRKRHFDRSSVKSVQLLDQILSCLDLRELPAYAREDHGAEAAVCLKEVMDRLPLPPAEGIPGIETVEASGGSGGVNRWQIPNTQIAIARIEEGEQRGEFLFTAGTVSRAPKLYSKLSAQPYRQEGQPVSEDLYQWWASSPGNPSVASLVERLPSWFQNRGMGLAIWQWIGLAIAIPISLTVMLSVLRFGRWQAVKSRDRSLMWYWVGTLIPLVAILIPLGFKHFAYEFLTLRGTSFYVVSFCANFVALLGLGGFMIVLSNRIAESALNMPQVARGSLDASLIRILCRVLGVVAATVVFLEGGRYLGFPLTTLIAGAGIGGLAIALSAQNLIKGLFGTVTILTDKPFRVGERIIVKGHDGVVEEIGLRSTKVRGLLSNHLISIPNDLLAESEIENVGRRKHIRRTADLHIPLDTPLAKIEHALAIIREILENHEGMDPELPPRVFFTDFNPESFNIRFIHWYAPPDFWKYYAFCEKVNLQIFRAFEDEGIQFSLPRRHSYWKTGDQQGPLEIALHRDSGESKQ